jgi:hypothetical protein
MSLGSKQHQSALGHSTDGEHAALQSFSEKVSSDAQKPLSQSSPVSQGSPKPATGGAAPVPAVELDEPVEVVAGPPPVAPPSPADVDVPPEAPAPPSPAALPPPSSPPHEVIDSSKMPSAALRTKPWCAPFRTIW